MFAASQGAAHGEGGWRMRAVCTEEGYRAEIARLEARLKGATVLLEGACFEIEDRKRDRERVASALAVMWDAWTSDEVPPHSVLKIAHECYLAGLAARLSCKSRRSS